jgi:prepilin-type N-terminal cleavage/methylation domain-containing protein
MFAFFVPSSLEGIRFLPRLSARLGSYRGTALIRPSARSRFRPPAFTLLELIVVIVVIAALAGLIVTNVGGVEDDQAASIIQSELATIRKAALQFHRDLGQPPQYLAELMQSADPADAMGGWWWRQPADQPEARLYAYDPATQRGWNGPYVLAEYFSTNGADGLDETRESRVNAAGAVESVDSDGSASPARRLAILRSDTGPYPQAAESGRLTSHYQLVFNDASGELVVRFVANPTEATPEVVAELRLGVKP